ncbi:MAG: ribose-5-phosphate isomerase RpiA [Chlamydiota bacterium]
MNSEALKKAVGYKAASFIENGMVVGLGTGSTAKYFIEKLIERQKTENLSIKVVASSTRSLELAKEGGLPILDINTITSIDITVDGADEIDSEKRMIKGGGGALLREKIVASMSRELIIIIDESKKSSLLGHKKLPVEVVPFACQSTLHKIQKCGWTAYFRKECEGDTKYYVTDNSNYIIDIYFSHPLEHPEKEHAILKEIPGVVETGFFFHLAGRIITSYHDGQVIVTP